MRLTVYAGQEFSADFTVVDDSGVVGQALDPSDTATFSIVSAGVNAACVVGPVAMAIVDSANGRFNIKLTSDQTKELTTVLGGQEDHFNPLSNYKGYMDFKLVSGDRQATVDLYVEMVLECQTAP